MGQRCRQRDGRGVCCVRSPALRSRRRHILEQAEAVPCGTERTRRQGRGLTQADGSCAVGQGQLRPSTQRTRATQVAQDAPADDQTGRDLPPARCASGSARTRDSRLARGVVNPMPTRVAMALDVHLFPRLAL